MNINTTEVKEDIENTQDDISKVANEFGKKTKHYIKNKQGEFEELANACCAHVKEHPIRSVLLGFGAGMLFGKLFSKIGK